MHDNGGDWFISGASDHKYRDDDLRSLKEPSRACSSRSSTTSSLRRPTRPARTRLPGWGDAASPRRSARCLHRGSLALAPAGVFAGRVLPDVLPVRPGHVAARVLHVSSADGRSSRSRRCRRARAGRTAPSEHHRRSRARKGAAPVTATPWPLSSISSPSPPRAPRSAPGADPVERPVESPSNRRAARRLRRRASRPAPRAEEQEQTTEPIAAGRPRRARPRDHREGVVGHALDPPG